MEVRVVDGYPWAPAEVGLQPVLGKIPRALKQCIGRLATGVLPSGAPILTGAGALVDVVKQAQRVLAE